MLRRNRLAIAAVAALAPTLAAAGCGSSKHASPSSSPSALAAEAKSTATGDIPDNQVFLTFRSPKPGYSIKYPEGWTQHGSGGDITFQDKNNLVHVVVGKGSAPTLASVRAQLQALKSANPTLVFQPPKAIQIGSSSALKATYTTRSAPNQVTGKRVTLLVDRYELAKNGSRAVVDLGTPKGVDNVDAYRMMIESFRWR